MKAAIIGTGTMGSRLARTLAANGTELLWGSRDPEAARLKIKELDLRGVQAVDVETALTADWIVHTLWFRDALVWARAHEEALAGKILVDIVNPFNDEFDDFSLEWGTSAAEELQRTVPRTKVVGAFKNTFASVFDRPVHEGVVSDVYVTSDDEAARDATIRLLTGTPFRMVDAGALRNNRTIERMTLLERELAIRRGHPGYVAFRLFGGPGAS
ncbi:NADPH-dependent F420 reductase [Paenibacillus sp.]|uniref:NADPH-dependent F420 reductase n=1 Tax=Paenibacillus sp. TaxID=58172 RepID=UPI002D28AEC0|nr:NAD(P)-binding domain-containing protein [Paenibacillus sp.]HZG57416.1 NAD(P)-binding domain-containing protein [Paenibacillus sp.]